MMQDEDFDFLNKLYKLGGRLKWLKEKDVAFRHVLDFIDSEYARHLNNLQIDEEARRIKQPNSFENDKAIKGRIATLKEIISFINLCIEKGENAYLQLQEENVKQ